MKEKGKIEICKDVDVETTVEVKVEITIDDIIKIFDDISEIQLREIYNEAADRLDINLEDDENISLESVLIDEIILNLRKKLSYMEFDTLNDNIDLIKEQLLNK